MNQRKVGIVLSYLCEAIKIISSLIYTPLMLRLLGQSEYGLYQLVSSTVSYLSLLSFGFGSAYVRYFSRYQAGKDREGIARLNGMFIVVFSSMSAVCLLCGGFLTANAEMVFGNGLMVSELAKAKQLLAILVINMALTFPNSVFDCYVTAHEQFIFQKLLRAAQSILNPFLTLPLLLMGYGSVAMVLVSTVLTVCLFLTNICYCRRKLKMKFLFRGLQFSLLKELWIFTSFIFLNQIIDQVNWSVDKFLLGRMCGTTAVAIYGVGGQINSLYLNMSTTVSNVFVPKVNRIVAESDNNTELTRLMARVGRVQFLILALVITGFAFFGKPFIRLWAGEEYEESYMVALLLILPVTVPLIQNLGMEIQRAKNRHQVRSIAYACLAVLNVVLSVFWIRRWGSIGAAAGTAVALIVGNILFMNWYYHKKIGLDMVFFWKEIGAFLPAMLIMCVFGIVFSACIKVQGWIQLLICIFVYTSVYGTVMWRFGLNTEEKRIFTGALRKLPVVKRRYD